MRCADTLMQPRSDASVECAACAHRCRIPSDAAGFCGVRRNREGSLESLMYGHPSAMHLDPIEKKPLYHVLPQSQVLSLGTLGCTMTCRWCQNCSVALPSREYVQRHAAGEPVSPQAAVEEAVYSGAAGLAYTYNEPTVWIEYARDTAARARQRGLINLWVSNGYLTPEAWEYIAPELTAANIDLKGFRERVHRRYTGARLQPVLDSIAYAAGLPGLWLEVTMLLIPEINDDPDEIRDACRFLAGLSPDIPLHLSAFYPAFRMQDHPATPAATLERARDIAREEGLRYVYLGNIAAAPAAWCPSCGHELQEMRTAGFSGYCPDCGTAIPGVWQPPGSE